MADASYEILDAIAGLRRAFAKANLEPPSVILLKSHKDGCRFLTALPKEQLKYFYENAIQPIEMADGAVYMECKVMAISVRWPANKMEMPDGSWRYF